MVCSSVSTWTGTLVSASLLKYPNKYSHSFSCIFYWFIFEVFSHLFGRVCCKIRLKVSWIWYESTMTHASLSLVISLLPLLLMYMTLLGSSRGRRQNMSPIAASLQNPRLWLKKVISNSGLSGPPSSVGPWRNSSIIFPVGWRAQYPGSSPMVDGFIHPLERLWRWQNWVRSRSVSLCDRMWLPSTSQSGQS